jgi:hypothetical protein
MSVAFVVSDIQDRIKFRCDLPTFTTETNVTIADALTLVKESARRLSGLIGHASDEAFFVTTETVATVADLEYASLPAGLGLVTGVHWLRGTNDPVPLRQATQEDMVPGVTNGWTRITPTYRIQGQTIEFWPTPQDVYSVRLRYSTGVDVISTSTTIYGQYGWDTWIVLDCCCTIRQRQDKDYSAFAAEKGLVEREILKHARRRDRVGVPTARDMRSGDWTTMALADRARNNG